MNGHSIRSWKSGSRGPKGSRPNPGINDILCRSISAIIVVITVISGISFGASDAVADNMPKVIVFHSYHKGFDWTDSIQQGIESKLSDKVDLIAEYMDTKRHLPEKSFPILLQYYESKYKGIHPKVIACSDDNSLNFLLKYHHRLFPEVPIVFCGVNNPNLNALESHKKITGIVEDIDIEATLWTALSLHPKAKTIVVISDSTATGAANLQRFYKIASGIDKDIRIIELVDYMPDELHDALSALKKKAIALRLSYFKDRTGRSFTSDESFRIPAQSGHVPVYSMWEYGLGRGMVGGKVVSGAGQGAAAANMILRVLDGAAPESLPISWKSPNEFMFDYTAMRKFGIEEADLPVGSKIVNKPRTMWSDYRRTVWSVIGGLFLLSGIVVLLLFNIMKRKMLERDLQNQLEFAQSLIDVIPNPVYYKDEFGNYVGCNKAFEELVGMPKHQILGSSIDALWDRPYSDILIEKDKEIFASHERQIFDLEITNSDGNRQVLVFYKAWYNIGDDERKGLVGVIVDITEHKNNEEELRNHKENLSELVEERTKALEASEERLNGIIRSNIDGMVVIDEGGEILFANPAAEKMLNMASSDVVGSILGKPSTQELCEMDLIDSLGNIVPVEMRTVEVEWEKSTAYLIALRDITDRKITEEQLRRTHQILVSHVENSPLAVVEWNKDFHISRWSRQAEVIFGWKAHETVGKGPHDQPIIHYEDQEYFEQEMQSLVSGEVPRNVIFCMNYTKPGMIVFCEWHNSALHNEMGELVSVLSLVHDVTIQKKAEERLKRANDELEERVEQRTLELQRAYDNLKEIARDRKQTMDELVEALHIAEDSRDKIDIILKSVADGLVVTDNYNRIQLMNKSAEDIFNLRLSETFGGRIDKYIMDRSLREELLKSINRAKHLSGYQFDFAIPDESTGATRYYQAKTAVILDRDMRQSGTVVTMRDVTREREVDKMKNEFISTAAHELRTPLTSIQGFSELLMSRVDLSQDERAKFLRYINDHSVNLSRIINDLLDITRIESGKGFSVNKTDQDLRRPVESKVQNYRAQYPDFEFSLDVPEEPAIAYIDRDKVEQLLENLLSNAVKYSPEHKVIHISVQEEEEAYRLTIKDRGRGMNTEQVRRMFEKFYRGHASDGGISGTGLGMSIVKYIVEAHGGHIVVGSKEGEGTEARVLLPRGGKDSPGIVTVEHPDQSIVMGEEGKEVLDDKGK